MSKHNFTIHHASLIVSDTEQSLQFYRDVLDMQPIERPPLPFPGAWLAIATSRYICWSWKTPTRPAAGRRTVAATAMWRCISIRLTCYATIWMRPASPIP